MSLHAIENDRLRTLGPLVAARVELDVFCKQQRGTLIRQLKAGENLAQLFKEYDAEPAYPNVEELLDSAPKLNDHNWLEWFQLKTAYAGLRQRVFARTIFSSHRATNDDLRARLSRAAYVGHRGILLEACSLQDKYTGHVDSNELTGSVSELLMLSLLNLAKPSVTTAEISNARADRFHKVDAIYTFMDKDGRGMRVPLQTKTGGEVEVMPDKVLQIGVQGLLGSQGALETITLLEKDANDDLLKLERKDLRERARSVQSVIANSSFCQAMHP